MTERETILAAMQRIGAEITEAPAVEYDAETWPDVPIATTVKIESEGYSGFYTVIAFDAEGRIVGIGAWE